MKDIILIFLATFYMYIGASIIYALVDKGINSLYEIFFIAFIVFIILIIAGVLYKERKRLF